MDTVTDAAMRLLWSKGYEATTIDDLVAATGINASSLYAAFGSKRALLDAALDRYEARMLATVGTVRDGAAGLDDVRAFLDRIRRHVASPRSPMGCLMLNTMTEVSAHDTDIVERIERYRAALAEGIGAGLTRAAERGEIDPATVAERTRMVRAGVFGALVLARAGAASEAVAAVEALQAEVARWAADRRRRR